MWTLTCPAVDEAANQIVAALTYANGTAIYDLTAQEKAAIASLYAHYDQLLGQPDAALNPPALAAVKDWIGDAYNQIQRRGRLADLRGALLSGLMECPLCGFGEPRTLDHYLPRDDYPSLAIYPRNLVPACQVCNRAKGIDVPGATPGFIHAYFQALPPDPFLHADIDYVAPALVVRFRVDHPDLDAPLLDRLRHQLIKLGLNDRYASRINTLLFEQKIAILGFSALDNGPAVLGGFLGRMATQFSGDFGSNHWKTALLRGLSGSAEFCANPGAFFAPPSLPADVAA